MFMSHRIFYLTLEDFTPEVEDWIKSEVGSLKSKVPDWIKSRSPGLEEQLIRSIVYALVFKIALK